jgi:maltose alpha-D-glucosyltransferase / alpha-amylase
MLQGLVANEGDGWQWTLDELDRYYEARVSDTFPADDAAKLPTGFLELAETLLPKAMNNTIGSYLNAAQTLGRRTGELHVALASPTDDVAFAPEPFTAADFRTMRDGLLENASRTFDALEDNLEKLPDDAAEDARMLLSRRSAIFDRLHEATLRNAGGMRIRIHGDYHLGQVLRTESDFVLLDFEGEPARSLEERRAKQSPLKDVAGMLRSFSYAAAAALMHFTTRHSQDEGRGDRWAHLWEQTVTAEFLKAYTEVAQGSAMLPEDASTFQSLLEVYVLEKALYELFYELNNRPDWVRIPLRGILSLSR